MLERAGKEERVVVEVLDVSTSPAHPAVPYRNVTGGHLSVRDRLREG